MAEMVQVETASDVSARLDIAERWLEHARRAATAHDAPAAVDAYRNALAAIGRLHVVKGRLDDGQTKLALAQDGAAAGRWDVALAIFDRITAARLTRARANLTGAAH